MNITDKYLKLINEEIDLEPYNINEFFSRLKKVVNNNDNIKVVQLDKVIEYPILFIHPKELKDIPTVLIAAGFHGDEISGPWSVLNFLEMYSYPELVNLSILPLVNPTGFNLSRRTNFWGQTPNRGYIKSYDFSKSSYEDEILKKNIDFIFKYGKDCLITLHEENEERFHIYTYGEKNRLDKKILKMGEDKFELVPEDRLKIGGFKVDGDGVRIDDNDGSFEHAMFVKGTKKTITTENPNRKPFKERVELYIDIIKEICKPKYHI